MIKNYFKTAWRNLFKNKTQSAINIAGLSIGLACSILIFLWVQNELRIDVFMQKAIDYTKCMNSNTTGPY